MAICEEFFGQGFEHRLPRTRLPNVQVTGQPPAAVSSCGFVPVVSNGRASAQQELYWIV
jgi:hypothetical protein